MHRVAVVKYTKFRQRVPYFSCPFIPLHQLIDQIQVSLFVVQVILFRLPVSDQKDVLDQVLGKHHFLAQLASATLVVEFVVFVVGRCCFGN